MTIKARRWNVITAAAGVAGVLLLATWTKPVVAGFLAGTALSGAACLAITNRRMAELAKQGDELAAVRARYDAAFATLAGQRERLRTAMEAELAAREVENRRACLRARADGYIEGALHALGRRLASSPTEAEADVISLAARRPHPSTDSPN